MQQCYKISNPKGKHNNIYIQYIKLTQKDYNAHANTLFENYVLLCKKIFLLVLPKLKFKKTETSYIIINQCLAKGEFYILKIHNTGSYITKLEAPSESETYMAQIQ